MRRRPYTRQVLFFLATVVMPAGVLTGLAVRLIRQESALARTRADEERFDALDQVRREVASRLEAIKLEEINRRIRFQGKTAPNDAVNPAIVLVGSVRDAKIPHWNGMNGSDGCGVGSGEEAARIYRAMLRQCTEAAGDAARPEGHILWEFQRAEQLEALANDFTTVRSRIESVVGLEPNVSAWLAYGTDPWLVTVTAPAAPLPSLVFVISSHQVAPRGTILVAGHTPTSFGLGGNFLDVSVEWPRGRFAPESRVPQSLFIAGLVFIVGTMFLAGYLVLRDVSREIKTAELQTQFVANVSHELKTPLTGIRLYADKLLFGQPVDERTRSEYVSTIINESERLSRLVDNVLEFSRIESGTKTYRMQPIDVADIVHAAARSIRYLLAQRGFTLNVSVDESVCQLKGDADAIEQAVLNLLTNAMKYSVESRIIDLRLRQDDEEAVIEVVDYGLGIEVAEQTRIFEKFYRVSSAQTERIAGTGLGLTLVRHIAEAHGGRVEVHSAIGKGSTFAMRFPAQFRLRQL
jgi:signal transduction histidine kinase